MSKPPDPVGDRPDPVGDPGSPTSDTAAAHTTTSDTTAGAAATSDTATSDTTTGAKTLHPPDPPLEGDVVSLRPFEESDADSIAEACGDPAILRFIPVPRPYGTADAHDYIDRTKRQWADNSAASFAMVQLDDPARLAGAINLRVFGSVGNCGYWVAPWARGRGIAPEALRLVAEWALNHLDLAMVILEIREENSPSIRVATKAGFHKSGRIDVNNVTLETGGLIFTRSIVDTPA